MTAIRWWNPSLDLLQTARTMDRVFDQLLGYGGATSPEANGSGSSVPTYYLPVDIMETEEAYLLMASVPGFAPEQVEVTFQEGVLTIQANAQPAETKGRWVRQERPWGSFVRRLELPQQILGDQISAAFDNGVLTVTVPKVAKPEPVRIPIGGGQKQLKG